MNLGNFENFELFWIFEIFENFQNSQNVDDVAIFAFLGILRISKIFDFFGNQGNLGKWSKTSNPSKISIMEMKGSGEEGATVVGSELEAKSSHCLRYSAFSHLLASFWTFLWGLYFSTGFCLLWKWKVVREEGTARVGRELEAKSSHCLKYSVFSHLFCFLLSFVWGGAYFSTGACLLWKWKVVAKKEPRLLEDVAWKRLLEKSCWLRLRRLRRASKKSWGVFPVRASLWSFPFRLIFGRAGIIT